MASDAQGLYARSSWRSRQWSADGSIDWLRSVSGTRGEGYYATVSGRRRLGPGSQLGAGMALRGYKDTRVASMINISAYWLFGLPLCWALAMGSPWNAPLGVRGFWFGMLAAIAVLGVVAPMRCAANGLVRMR